MKNITQTKQLIDHSVKQSQRTIRMKTSQLTHSGILLAACKNVAKFKITQGRTTYHPIGWMCIPSILTKSAVIFFKAKMPDPIVNCKSLSILTYLIHVCTVMKKRRGALFGSTSSKKITALLVWFTLEYYSEIQETITVYALLYSTNIKWYPVFELTLAWPILTTLYMFKK